MSQANKSEVSSPQATEWRDPVIELYKKDVDRTLLRENLKLSIEERIRKAQSVHASIDGWRKAKRVPTNN